MWICIWVDFSQSGMWTYIYTCVKACPSLSLRSWSLFTSVCLYSNNTCLSLHVEGQRNVEENELSKWVYPITSSSFGYDVHQCPSKRKKKIQMSGEKTVKKASFFFRFYYFWGAEMWWPNKLLVLDLNALFQVTEYINMTSLIDIITNLYFLIFVKHCFTWF